MSIFVHKIGKFGRNGQEIATEVGFTIVDVRKFGGQESSGLHSDNEDKNEKIIILKK